MLSQGSTILSLRWNKSLEECEKKSLENINHHILLSKKKREIKELFYSITNGTIFEIRK